MSCFRGSRFLSLWKTKQKKEKLNKQLRSVLGPSEVALQATSPNKQLTTTPTTTTTSTTKTTNEQQQEEINYNESTTTTKTKQNTTRRPKQQKNKNNNQIRNTNKKPTKVPKKAALNPKLRFQQRNSSFRSFVFFFGGSMCNTGAQVNPKNGHKIGHFSKTDSCKKK